MFQNGKFSLSEESIKKIIRAFPKVRKEITQLISESMDTKLWEGGRYPGRKDEYLTTTGLCATISWAILPLMKEAYPDIKVVTGFYKLDKHPRYKDRKIYSLHSWLEADGKILDFTANQFAPFVNYPIDEVQIMPKAGSQGTYMKYDEEYQDVGLDQETIFEFYVENL